MIIRSLAKNDINAVLTIEEAVHLSPWNKETFLMCLAPHYAGFVASAATQEKREHHVIAFVIFAHHAEECHILNLAVSTAYQHQGVGTALLEHALKEAMQTYHAKIAYLEVRRSNTRAISLYQQFHFEHIGERKDYYQEPYAVEDALIFAKWLQSK